ncbi:MAG: acetolactate decarboxylase, partial [Breznakiellaceae bacterium]
TRSVPKQQKPYPRLVEVTKNQPTFEAKDIEGTLIGVWLPEYMAGVNMAGFHLHFISKDLSFGGHLLEIDMPKATVEIDYTYGLQLTLPSQSDFFTTTLKQDKEELKKIEQ